MLRSEMGDDPARIAAALSGLRAYQTAARPPSLPPPPVIGRVGRASLRDYGGDGPPVVFVPSLINPSSILDLDAERSLLRWLAARGGMRPMLVDWGSPRGDERARDIGGHVADLLLPLLDVLDEPPILAGYCLGGTMALAAAALRKPRALALIATPWRFAGFGPETAAALAALWEQARDPADGLGLMPMEVLQAAFWQLDPRRTLAKFERFGAQTRDDTAVRSFVAVEDWANDGPPLTFAAARELMEDLFAADLPGRGSWQVGGRSIDPRTIDVPVLEIVSTTDRIVPAAAAAGIGEQLPLALGHVGMIVGGRARTAAWEPLARWLSRTISSC